MAGNMRNSLAKTRGNASRVYLQEHPALRRKPLALCISDVRVVLSETAPKQRTAHENDTAYSVFKIMCILPSEAPTISAPGSQGLN